MIFIPGNVPSLKNGKKPVSLPGKKYTTLVHSDSVKKYIKSLGIKKYSQRSEVEDYLTRQNIFRKEVGNFFENISYPCILGFNFVRDSQRRFDIINAMQIICDLLVAHGFIIDDDANHLIPIPFKIKGSWYSVCRDRPGVWIALL